MMYDVAIIGAGVVGGMVARALAAYDVKICILEKENDVAMGATKANSAIVHAGFDAPAGSLKAKLNVKGSQMMEQVTKELGVSYQKNGSLVIGFSEADKTMLEALYQRGMQNGVKDLRLIGKEELKQLEPNISEHALYALYAPTGAIICPYELTVAAIGNAMDNGAELKCNFPVTNIQRETNSFTVFSGNQSVQASYIVNAAGVFSDKIAAMVGDTSFSITPRRGEYILLDKECGTLIRHTVFTPPTDAGKGILVSPTVDGNLLTGPTSVNLTDKEDKTTTAEGFAQIIREAGRNVNGIPYQKSITSFCGLRAAGSTGDFIINAPVPGFVNAAGIESPGLSASPAIAEMICELLKAEGLALQKKSDYHPIRKSMHFFRNASLEEKNEIIRQDSRYGRIICRCETVSEGEIREAIRQNPRPSDLDGVKRRTRAQMGRCQGGFCMPHIMQILSEELGIPMTDVTKTGGNSKQILGTTKGEN